MVSTSEPPLSIDRARFARDLAELNEIGWTAEHGMCRTSFSDEHMRARRWFVDRAEDAGLATRVDSAANHSARLEGPDPGARTLMLGSHLDSVPSGGRYDGALGVLCALEVLRTIGDAGLRLPVALEAIDFTDEEGTILGTLGSWAMAGRLTEATLAEPRCGRDVLLAALGRAGLTEAGLFAARRDPATIAGFLELHVEQGPVLETAGVQIGVVTGIRGNESMRVTFRGAGRHAGTTPMGARRDAGLGAAALMLAVRETVMDEFPGCVANVGGVRLTPGAFNVVPASAELALEARSLDDAELDRLTARLTALAAVQAERFDLELEVRPVGRWTPATTHAAARGAIAAAASALELSVMEMPSGAGHDAQVMADITPTGMVFVPSRLGISHHPDEFTTLEDCVNGANVLLGAAVRLAHAL